MADLISNTIELITPLDEEAIAEARARQDLLTKPQGSLGRLEDLSVKLAGIQGKVIPELKHKAIITIAGDHGVVAEGVGNWPQEVTAQMVDNFLQGGAGVNIMAAQAGARNVIVDMGVAAEMETHPRLISRKISTGTGNIANGPAMTVEQATRAVETGIEIVNDEVARGLDIVGTGDMGIGNTTASSAISVVMTGKRADEVTGRGTGITDEQLAHKTDVVNRAITVNNPDPSQPLEVLAKVGGFEIGGLVGVMLGAAAHRIPVVIDGFISGAAALIAVTLSPRSKEYLIASHVSTEVGHAVILEQLELKPLLSLGMRLGEGTGAALGIYLCETAVRILAEMSTFSEAGVSEKNEEDS